MRCTGSIVGRIALLAILGGSPPWAQAGTIESKTEARYQGAGLVQSASSLTDPPLNSPVVAEAISDPSGDDFSFARGFASGERTGSNSILKSLSYAAGFDPNYDPPADVEARSAVISAITYTVSSASLDPATPIEIRLEIPMSGTLATEEYFTSTLAPNELFAQATASLRVDGNLLYTGSGRSEEDGSGNSILLEAGDWIGDFGATSLNPGLLDDDAFKLDTVDVVSFNATLGDPFEVVFELKTEAYIIGPYEALAIADFANTGEYRLSVVNPATGDPWEEVVITTVPSVPEPASCVIAVSAFSLLFWRRRSRGELRGGPGRGA